MPLSRSEALANEAAEVEPRPLCGSGLIVRARIELDGRDPLVARRLRNYRAMHHLNQGDHAGAIAELDGVLPKSELESGAEAKDPRSTPSQPNG